MLSLSVCSAVTAEGNPESPNPMSDSPVLVAALAELDYPPFYFREDDALTGFSIEVLNRVAEQLGIVISYRRLSWPRVLQSLRNGQVDMVTTFTPTPERQKMVFFTSLPHAVEHNHLFVRADRQLDYKGELQSLSPYLIGVITGYSYGAEFDQAEYLHKDEVLDEQTLVRMVLGKRFDAGVGNPFAIRLEAAKYGRAGQLTFVDPPINSNPIHMGFSRKLPQGQALAERFSQAIARLKSGPDYQQLLRKYHLQPNGVAMDVNRNTNTGSPN